MFHPLLFLLSFWYILPAYVANGFAVLAGLLPHRHPIDGGRLFNDGYSLFGPGKTWEGFLGGFFSGVTIGGFQVLSSPVLLNVILQAGLILPPDFYLIVLLPFPLVVVVALGALVGDIMGSFIKRRLKIARGKPAPLLDQLDFLLMALFFGFFVYPLPLLLSIFILIITPIIHLLANAIGYLIGVKDVPW